LLINLFVLPIALGGLLHLGGRADAETFVLTLPMAQGWHGLTLLAFVGGLSAATGMVIVETIAVSTMVCNDLVMPVLLRTKRWGQAHGHDVTRLLLRIRRVAILLVLMFGYLYYHLAGEAYALVSIGLISFAAVAQFAPALLGGMYWKGGTRRGAVTGLLLGFAVWAYTLMLPSLAKSGWLSPDFLFHGPWGIALLKPEQLFGLQGLDNLTHSLFWSMLFNAGAYVLVSVWRSPSASETSQALLFVDVFDRTSAQHPVFWRGQASVGALLPLAGRILGMERARQLFQSYARSRGADGVERLQATPELVQFVETQLAGAIGSASARVMVASVVKEEPLDREDVLGIVDEANRLRLHSRELEEKSRSLELATAELRAANEQLQSLDRLKDDFMSSVTHELRTPLTSIRALSELMLEDASMEAAQRHQFLGIIVSETERLTRLVNQVLDMAKIESGHAEWHNAELDIVALVRQSVQTTAEMLRERGSRVTVRAPSVPVFVRADPDRLTQVMLNLLSNAAKFVPPGRGQVDIRVERQARGVVVEVCDNGPGVPAEEHEQVFQKFRQGGSRVNRPQGTGLGLPISRQIIEHFGGRMWLRSSPGEGAAFSFLLPVTTPGAAPQDTGDKP
jgi:signal transduction histidine kinase